MFYYHLYLPTVHLIWPGMLPQVSSQDDITSRASRGYEILPSLVTDTGRGAFPSSIQYTLTNIFPPETSLLVYENHQVLGRRAYATLQHSWGPSMLIGDVKNMKMLEEVFESLTPKYVALNHPLYITPSVEPFQTENSTNKTHIHKLNSFIV